MDSLALYVLVDQSGSMASCLDPALEPDACEAPGSPPTRLSAVRGALTQFVQEQASAGMSVGLGYFGHQPIGETSCSPSDYATPAVPFGRLPEHATALLTSLDAMVPMGETPTGPGLRGTCSYTKLEQQANPSRRVVALLVTDGEPLARVSCSTSGCCPTLEDATAAATECWSGSPGIPTYVVAIGPDLSPLTAIAQAGGTESAHLVEGVDVEAQLLSALRAVRTTASACD